VIDEPTLRMAVERVGNALPGPIAPGKRNNNNNHQESSQHSQGGRHPKEAQACAYSNKLGHQRQQVAKN